jgi:hypothetical protein
MRKEHPFTPELERHSIANADVRTGKLLHQRGGLGFLRRIWRELPPSGTMIPRTVHVTRTENGVEREYLGRVDGRQVIVTHILDPDAASTRFDKIPKKKIDIENGMKVEQTVIGLKGLAGSERTDDKLRRGEKREVHARSVYYHMNGSVYPSETKSIMRGEVYAVHDGENSYLGIFGKENPLKKRRNDADNPLKFTAYYQRSGTPGVFRKTQKSEERIDGFDIVRIAKVRGRKQGN